MPYQSDTLDRLHEIARALNAGESPSPITVRSFLRWFFGSQRRGSWIVSFIRSELNEAGLVTAPDFESTYLDAEIEFQLVRTETAPATQTRTEQLTEALTVADSIEVRVIRGTSTDPTYRVSKLAAANHRPVSVHPDATVIEATTLMLANDFSQLPVMTSDRDVRGMISWTSIGSRLTLGKPLVAARDALELHAEISTDASLFSVIPLIVEHEYVLVRGADKKVVGIVTTSDLSVQFRQLSEPFLLLGEIENHVRRIIDSSFSQPDLCAIRDPVDSERVPSAASDMTVGEYKRLLEDPARWSRLKLNVDRVVFIKLLDRVREIRNDVMHFDPDGIAEDDLDALRDFSRFLGNLQALGAT